MARELLLRRLRHIPFRNSHNGEACEAYRRMGVSDFTGINVLQAWANWRTIPRNMSDVLPARPLMVVDLCCAIGQSTAVLAHYCPPGSRFLGLESSEEFVTIARQTAFRTRDGRRADAEFHAQDVLKPFGDGDGQIVRSGSVDLVNCSGAIGCHFAPQDTARLVGEVRRVLAAGGLAMLDSGREGTGARTLREIAEASDLSYLHRVRSCLADPRWQLCFRKVGH
jgi:SAM-dependent methyltransferase